MEVSAAYSPQNVFTPVGADNEPAPRVFIAPARYIQGRNVLAHTGRYLTLCNAHRVAVLISARGRRTDGVALLDGLDSAGIEAVVSEFGGECSLEEVEAHVRQLSSQHVDCVLAVGGGKCVDAGKAVAFRLGVPVAVAPTLASNDAPCSALSVLYDTHGVSTGVEFYPQSPALVVVDTAIVASAPERYLVAGMGDAMATFFEARVCLDNPAAANTIGARPTLAARAIGEVCAQTLFAQGEAAAAAVRDQRVDADLEAIVEANTLLSGLGFESGGLAAAHGVAQSYTAVPVVHANHLHGEMVAMGLLAQLVLEARTDEAVRVADFFAAVGLPVHLGQVSLDAGNSAALDTVAEATMATPFIGNMPMPLDAAAVRDAVVRAHALGVSVAERAGDAAWRRLQSA